MLLSLKYRPAKFADLTGQNSARLILQALAFGDDVPPSLIFEGTRGSGKTSAARILAAVLNCENPSNGDNCGECSSCVDIRSGQSMAVHEIDAASHGGVDNIRELKELTQYASGGKWRVILLDEAHSLSRQAFNALLKMLEEPPPYTVFVLLTTEPDKIMSTVRSRSMAVNFRPITEAAIVERLDHISSVEGIEGSPEFFKEIAKSSGGSLRDGINLLDQAHRTNSLTVEAVRLLTGRTDTASKIMTCVVTQNHKGATDLVEEFFQSSSDSDDLITDLLDQLKFRFHSNAISPKQMVAATKFLWEARSAKPTSPRDSRVRTEALVTLLYGVFYVETVKKTTSAPILKVEPTKAPEPKPADEPLTLEGLTSLVKG